MALIAAGVVPDATLETFRTRAAVYDRENRFFQEDFDDPRDAGYLRMAVAKLTPGINPDYAQRWG